MINKKRLTRFLSVILTAAILLSTLPTVGLFASAEEVSGAGANFADKTKLEFRGISSSENSVFFANTGMSLVKTLPYAYDVYNEGGNWVEKNGIQEGTSAYLADRDVESRYLYNTNEKAFTNANHYMCSRRGYVTKRTDGSTDEYGTNIDDIKVDGTEYAVDIVHDLLKVEDVSRVLINHHPTKALRAGHYHLYASETREDLFKDESLVYKVVYDYVNQLGQIFNFPTPVKARYVAIRVFNPYATKDETEIRSGAIGAATKSAGNAYIRMFEFNVFGAAGATADVVENREYSYKKTNDKSDPSKYPEFTYNAELEEKNSLVANRTPEKMFFMKNGAEYPAYTVLAGNKINADCLTDNDSDTGAELRADNSTDHIFANGISLIDDEEKMYLQFNYKLDGEASVTDVSLFYHQSDDLSAGHIKLSVADTEENLFSGSENSYTTKDIYSVFGSATKVTFASPKKGRYVGIRIITPVKKRYTSYSNYYTRLAEISVGGNYLSLSNGINYTYKIEGTSTTKTGNEKIEYTSNPDSLGKYSAGTPVRVTLPASVRDSEGNIHSLKSWTASNPTMSGSDTVIEFTLEEGKTARINAVYGVSDKPDVNITFKNYWGEVIHQASVTYGQYLSREDYEAANAALGDVPGKELKYSLYHFGSRVAEMPVWNEDIYNYAAGADITFTPLYVTSAETYTVKYSERKIGMNGNSVSETFVPVEKQCRFGDKITCENPSAKYWTVNGQPWCSGDTFIGYVTEDMEIAAVTNSLGKTAAVSIAENPVVSGSSVSFAGRIAALPSGALIESIGLVLVSGDSEVTEITTSNCQQLIRANKRNGNDFMITVTNLPRKVTRRARMYLTYDASSTDYGTIYSKEVTVTIP